MKKPRQLIYRSFVVIAAFSVIGWATIADKSVADKNSDEVKSAAADLIISGGPIITMDVSREEPEAVAVRNGKILAVGSTSEIEALRGADTEQLDLNGRTLLPGFIDGHSHFSMAVNSAAWANLSAAPVGNISNIADIIAELQAQAQRNKLAPGDWLVGYGYDQDTLQEARHATRDDLDAAFPDNPVIIIHVSFHGAVLNSKAFEAINYDETTPTPEGGVIVRREGGTEPLGLIMETAWFPAVAAIPGSSAEQRIENIKLAQALYAANGITTMQEGLTSYEEFSAFKEAAQRGDFYLDLAVLGSYAEIPAFAAEKVQYENYDGRPSPT
jgi:predicted amidohydrolase YtcJ